MPTTQQCAVIGHPVAHSLSPAIHRAAYRSLGLDWSYRAVDVEPGGLPAFVAGLDETWRGLSVTAPHKIDLVGLGAPDDPVRRLGVANTWVRTADGPVVANTDVTGFVLACRTRGLPAPGSVAVVGAGATARSVIAAAAQLGAHDLTIVSRSLERSSQALMLAAELGLEAQWMPLGEAGPGALSGVDLLVSTVPAAGLAEVAEGLVAGVATVFDVVYDPWPTPLATAAAHAGAPVLDGLDLLAGQAVDQVRLMTGHEVPLDLLRSAAQDGLNARL
ncbi:Putative shikimate 5-dehydrogenase [Acidipropionibacterium acidipropionici ATCC 4875]|uniref:Shikimate 5-dehydrogenase n=1 Tax=Acidipropionibacterium acidipropionici (strain ATCC 4875 / DSM 20272 / JCM 6432 / NBRC 12425 / NCIMB 8070 / 4) TaxID=1171373 RepID=K7RT33_ACIA4|nr:shikimate dehydrogenase [Acidipropionibacterium acidipropionici]AFV89581.1 Putative shikimate 5-dehydrogenase [Acidipropionibacterium acidipropionici ATCC 4875]